MATTAPEPRLAEQDANQLVATARSLARRSWALARMGRSRSACSLFTQCTHEATQLLDAAADFLRASSRSAPSHERGYGADRGTPDPRDVARLMTDALAVDATDLSSKPTSPSTVLHGRCESVSVNELLSFLGTLGKTGTLSVETREERFTIQMEDGYVVHASSNRSPPALRLGAILVEQGAIEPDRLRQFLRTHDRSISRLGVALEREELVSREQLTAALEHQIQHVFKRISSSSDAAFAFEEHEGGFSDERVRLGVVRLLLESAAALDEANRPAAEPV